jgi:hypothetical protein
MVLFTEKCQEFNDLRINIEHVKETVAAQRETAKSNQWLDGSWQPKIFSKFHPSIK